MRMRNHEKRCYKQQSVIIKIPAILLLLLLHRHIQTIAVQSSSLVLVKQPFGINFGIINS